ncbi:hypothetical protein [Sphingomonas azotifigens]|uniref:hypothetical protein n=1 Tax=Sphingomonas azotifigens TaxID=330920 RepID=UPI000A0798F3|nr:hypothetical protein [Sphingomonas azotifigens]
MRKLVVSLLLATMTLSTPALAHAGAGGVGFGFVQGDALELLPDVENKGDHVPPPPFDGTTLDFRLDLDASDFLPDVENQGGAHPIPSDPPSPPRA